MYLNYFKISLYNTEFGNKGLFNIGRKCKFTHEYDISDI